MNEDLKGMTLEELEEEIESLKEKEENLLRKMKDIKSDNESLEYHADVLIEYKERRIECFLKTVEIKNK